MKSLSIFLKTVSAIFVFSMLTACGGGGGGSPSDTTAPETTITSSPAALSTSTDAAFEFISNEVNSTFEVSIDGGTYTGQSNPFNITGLVDGAHSVNIRAIDQAGNVDTTPASHSWDIDTSAPVVEILFPATASSTDANTIVIRGTATDFSSVTSVAVNGVNAVTSDNFQNWQATLAVNEGSNTYIVTAADSLGHTDNNADSCNVISRGTILQSAYTTRTTASGSHTYIFDIALKAIVVIDNSTGIRSILSDANTGTGSVLNGAYDFAIDEANSRLITVDWITDLVMSVSMVTGNRTILSNTNTGAPTEFSITAGVTYDATNNRIFVVDGDDSVFEVNLSSGVRSIITSPSVGTGISFSNSLSVEYDAQTDVNNPRLLIPDSALSAVIAVDIATGNRSIFSSTSPNGTGSALSVPVKSYLDLTNNRLLVIDADLNINQLISIDLNTGDRVNVTSVDGWNVWPYGYSFDADAANLYLVTRTGSDVLSINLTTDAITEISSMSVGTGPKFASVRSISFDTASNSIIVPDSSVDAIYRVNLENGNREIVSSNTKGIGTNFNAPINAVLDTTTNPLFPRMLVLDSGLDALLYVDLTSGDRTIISSATMGTGTNFQIPRDLTVDYANNDAYVVEAYVIGGILKGFVHRVDLSNGNRTLVSSENLGAGINLVLSNSIAFDNVTTPSTPRLLVGDGQTFGIVDVDPVSGDRSMFSSSQPTGVGIGILLPTETLLDSTNARLLVVDSSRNSIIAVNLLDASRTLISGNNSDSTSVLGNGPLKLKSSGIDSDFDNDVLYLGGGESIVMVDALTGERVIISW